METTQAEAQMYIDFVGDIKYKVGPGVKNMTCWDHGFPKSASFL